MEIRTFISDEELPALPEGLDDFSVPSLRAHFGFKIVKSDEGFAWELATEDEFRKSEAERLGTSPQEVNIRYTCYQTGPRQCGGSCSTGRTCRLVYNPAQEFYYCACTGPIF